MRVFTQKPKATQQTTSAKSTIPSRLFSKQSRDVHSILQLQRNIGNQSVQRLPQANAEEINAGPVTKTSTRFAQNFSRISLHAKAHTEIQPKLTVTTPGDIYEQEADRVADQVVRMHETQLQHDCPSGGGCPSFQKKQPYHENGHLQSKRDQASNTGQITAPPIVNEVLRFAGQSLGTEERQFMEPRFGHDFSRVRVHIGPEAASAAKSLSARAFTVGNHLVFGHSQFNPGTIPGQRLIAHELTHVLQQSGMSASSLLQRQPDNTETPVVQTNETAAERRDIVFVMDSTYISAARLFSHATPIEVSSPEEMVSHLKSVDTPLNTIFVLAHSLPDGKIRFSTNDWRSADSLSVLLKVKPEFAPNTLDFRGCSIGMNPAGMEKLRKAVGAKSVVGSTCYMNFARSPSISLNGIPITDRNQLRQRGFRAEFNTQFRTLPNQFNGKYNGAERCIVNPTQNGYFQAGGHLVSIFANKKLNEPYSDEHSVCYGNLPTTTISSQQAAQGNVPGTGECKLVKVDVALPQQPEESTAPVDESKTAPENEEGERP